MAFSQEVINGIVGIANRERIEPAALLAVVQVESAGKPYNAADTNYPIFLFERHIFYRELSKLSPSQLAEAVRQGLANKTWQRTTQYLDQNTAAKRIAILQRATAIHKEAAYRSCSWGVGQIMGFNFAALGFPTAVMMVEFMQRGKQTAQIDCMVRFIKSKNLIRHINAHNWASFANAYNGAGYAQNQYDTKMAIAYKQWKNALNPNTPMTVAEVEEPELPPVRLDPVTESMGQSKIANGAATAGGLGVMGVFGKVWESIQSAPESLLTGLGVLLAKPTFYVFLAIVAVGIFIWYQRYLKLQAETA